jgi:hypothetical protein
MLASLPNKSTRVTACTNRIIAGEALPHIYMRTCMCD